MMTTETTLSDAVNRLAAGEGQMRATIHITRKATGVTETHDLIFTPLPADEQAETHQQEP